MRKPASRSRRRPRPALMVITVIVAAALGSIGIYGILHARATEPTVAPNGAGNSASSSRQTTPPTSATWASPLPIAATTNPQQFARQVGVAVFTWDTTSGYDRSDYIQAVITVADPSGQETPGLASDLDNYLPTRAVWAKLRQYETRQWLTITTAAVPSTWAQALQQGQGTLLPGTTAYTIRGMRHRAGTWDRKLVSTAARVSFTIFETCQPTYTTCRLLRLSQPDNPLR